MRHEKIKDYEKEKFKRLTSVKKETFGKMLNVLETELRDFGRPPKLSRADQLLMTLISGENIGLSFTSPKLMAERSNSISDNQKSGRGIDKVRTI